MFDQAVASRERAGVQVWILKHIRWVLDKCLAKLLPVALV